MQNNPKAKKAAKTRAKNAHKRLAMRKEREAATLSAQTMIEKRNKAYRDMEPYLCDLSHAATIAMEISDIPALFLFAVTQLDDMIERFKSFYYETEFLP